jgi:hypothetical protein
MTPEAQPISGLALRRAGVGLLALAVLCACGSSGTPTAPPTPVPTPTPTPVPTPTPDPNVPPAGSGCGKPYPPPISRFGVKTLYKDTEFWTVDATPLVGPDAEFCLSIGFTDGRVICPLRPEGAPDREACEEWRSGTAKDTGKPGPTWTFIDIATGKTSYCSSAPDAPCDHHTAGPFTVKAYKGGTYRVCTEQEACGETVVDRNL